MLMIQWSDGQGVHDAVTAKHGDAWAIYWALKKSLEGGRPPEDDYWIQIHWNGQPLNPERGAKMPACRSGEGSRFVLRPGSAPRILEGKKGR